MAFSKSHNYLIKLTSQLVDGLIKVRIFESRWFSGFNKITIKPFSKYDQLDSFDVESELELVNCFAHAV